MNNLANKLKENALVLSILIALAVADTMIPQSLGLLAVIASTIVVLTGEKTQDGLKLTIRIPKDLSFNAVGSYVATTATIVAIAGLVGQPVMAPLLVTLLVLSSLKKGALTSVKENLSGLVAEAKRQGEEFKAQKAAALAKKEAGAGPAPASESRPDADKKA